MTPRSNLVSLVLSLFLAYCAAPVFAQTGDSDTVTVKPNSVAAPKCTASVAMRGVPGFPGTVEYQCADSSVASVRAYVTVDGFLFIVPMRKDSEGSFTSSIPVSGQIPTFIAFQQETADKRVTISDNIPYSPACADPLAYLSEKNSPFGPVAERNLRAAVKLGQEIEQLNYIKGAIDRIAALGEPKGGK